MYKTKPVAIVSGFTSEQAQGNSRVGYPALPPGIKLILEDLGYDARVQPMRVDTVDSDLAEADLLVIGTSPIIAVGSRYLYGALDAIGKARDYDVPMLWYISDWQVRLLTSSVRTILNGPHRLTKEFMRHRTDFLWANHHEDELLRVIQAMNDRPWPITLVPSHPWRNDMPLISKYIPSRELVYFDPTAYTSGIWAPHDVQTAPDARAREWVLAALGDYSGWVDEQQFSWPVRYFGGKTGLVNSSGDKTTSPRIKEPEVHRHYSQTWGGLAPAHNLSGCGWWRSRWDFILKNGGIIYGDMTEMELMGEAFTNKVSDIESLSTQGLIDLQHAQREAHQIEPRESVLETFARAIAKAKSEL